MRLLEILAYINRHGVLPLVDSSRQWRNYSDSWSARISLDFTHLFFRPCVESMKWEGVSPLLFSSDGRDQFGSYSNIRYEDCAVVLERYFSPSPLVLAEMAGIQASISLSEKNTCAVIYRGNDKSLETEVPSPEDVVERARILREKDPSLRFWIQSDEVDFYHCFKSAFPDSLDLGLPRIHRQQTALQNVLRGSEKTRQAIRFLAVMHLMGRCKNLIVNSGNVGMWCCLWRGSAVGVHQYLSPKREVYGVVNPDYGVIPSGWLMH